MFSLVGPSASVLFIFHQELVTAMALAIQNMHEVALGRDTASLQVTQQHTAMYAKMNVAHVCLMIS